MTLVSMPSDSPTVMTLRQPVAPRPYHWPRESTEVLCDNTPDCIGRTVHAPEHIDPLRHQWDVDLPAYIVGEADEHR